MVARHSRRGRHAGPQADDARAARGLRSRFATRAGCGVEDPCRGRRGDGRDQGGDHHHGGFAPVQRRQGRGVHLGRDQRARRLDHGRAGSQRGGDRGGEDGQEPDPAGRQGPHRQRACDADGRRRGGLCGGERLCRHSARIFRHARPARGARADEGEEAFGAGCRSQVRHGGRGGFGPERQLGGRHLHRRHDRQALGPRGRCADDRGGDLRG